MTEQDKRAVESMCRCGLSLDAIIDSFSSLDSGEIEEIFNSFRKTGEVVDIPILKINCS